MDRGEESRERLVRAAVELVVEHHRADTDLRDVFSYLTPGAVASRAGLSRGLLYHHWAEEGDDGAHAVERFLRDVADRLVADSVPTAEVGALAEALPANISDLITSITAFEMARSVGWASEEWRATMGLTLHGVAPRGAAEQLVERLAEMYRRLCVRLGVELVPPLSFDDLALAVMAVFDGFSLHVAVFEDRVLAPVDWTPVTPSSMPDEQHPWNLVAIALEGVVTNMVRPVTGGDTVTAGGDAVTAGGGTPPRTG